MIPQRISVQGFLCYRDVQEIGFDSAALWLLAGLNGSGKSAVFDGVTYALFGGHRAGKEHADELINKGSDRAAVEFDFLLDGQLYRARRTLKRKKQGGAAPTQQMLCWQAGVNGDPGRWQAIPDTTNKRDFDRWVTENIGLTYETFTSSVLLMQGRAEKLLSATPKDRFEVLAGIVDLERFQHLHDRADEQRRKLKEQVEVAQQQLSRLAEVSDAELEAADRQITSVEETVQRGQAEGERLQRLEVLAEQWRDGQARLAAAQEQFRRAEQLLADAAAIERDWARLRALRAVVPQLAAVLEWHERLARSTQKCETLAAEQRALAERIHQLVASLDDQRRQLHGLHQAIADEQQREQAIGTELRELTALLSYVHFCETQRQELARLDAELAKLPADPAALVAEAQREHDRLATLDQVVPLLCRFRGVREELAQAAKDYQAAIAEQSQVLKDGEELKQTVASLEERLTQAVQARQQADERATATRTLLHHARQQVEQLNELTGAKVCRHCGQALTPEHIADERVRRQKVLARAEAEAQQAAAAQQTAIQAAEALSKEKKEKDAHLAVLRDEYRECRTRFQEAEREAERRARECLRLYHDLPGPFRERIAPRPASDWLTTAFPRKEDLDLFQREAQARPAALRRLQEAQTVHDRYAKLTVERETRQGTLSAQEAALPDDVAALRRRHAELETEDVALKQSLKSCRAEQKTVQEFIDRVAIEQQTLREKLSDIGQQSSAEEARREEGFQSLQRLRTALPADWQAAAESLSAAAFQQWRNEQQALEAGGVESRGEELSRARTGLEPLRQRVAELEAAANQVPEEARCDPTEVKARLTALRRQQTASESALRTAHQEKTRLLDRREQRRQLEEQRAALDLQHNRYRLLAELLGRQRLQLYLVRQAERGIVDHANAVLDRLSGGQLYLRLRGEESADGGTDQALQLEAYNRSTGQEPIGVAFLSGSQRFRVAVSLALGIGQYASRQHRPIESVIIDEGFGCLDRQGRQVMIQELQNLRGQLRCILLVSHQEEFAEAFADGYRFELTDGSTQVTRFQR